MPSSPDSTLYWKRKLAAYLHDPPSKALDIRLHEEHVRTLYRQAGLTDEEELRRLDVNFAKPSDWTASSADRLPFPKSRGKLSSVFDGVRARFHHPLSPAGSEQCIHFHKEFESAEIAKEADSTVQPIISNTDGWSEADLWRARFFAHWRLWEKFSTEKDARFALFPADTRIPDHTIWTHMQVVSALDGCARGYGKEAILQPAFLRFQLGGVQDFIGQARSTRDLWSGSYLLSWLMAAGMKALAWEVGPDAVIFPNLKGQPLFDLHLRDCLWSQLTLNGKNGWDHVKPASKNQLTTPNLPNAFLAVVPQDRAAELGKLVADAIQAEWEAIAENCWDHLDQAGMIPEDESDYCKADRKVRFNHQISHQLSLGWQATPWPESLDAALALANPFTYDMPIRIARSRVEAVIRYATQTMPVADRDGRYYVGGDSGPKDQLNNIGLGWSVILAASSWQLDATRSLRSFDAWSTGTRRIGTFQNKDTLNGQTEAVAGGREWFDTAQNKGGAWKMLFKHDDWLGAAALVKRVWHLAHLKEKWGLPTDSKEMPIPDTRQIARGERDGDGDAAEAVEKGGGDNYFAILALDGDSIGEWVSGKKTPAIRDQVSDYTDAGGQVGQGALKYFQDHGGGAEFLSTSRPLSPSYHLQFSAALSNFALHFAGRIVQNFQGRLIYSGGDDVLAILPAFTALDCARALRAAFRGEDPGMPGMASPAPGYLTLDDCADDFKRPIPFILPGSAADCSVGIAIAHFKSPLQDTVRAAQAAEKRAKKLPNKAAVAITVMKRSGETVEWSARWEDAGVQAATILHDALNNQTVSSKFPYRLGELISAYRTQSTGLIADIKSIQLVAGFDLAAVFTRELRTVLSRQRGLAWDKNGSAFEQGFTDQMQKWIKAMLAKPEPRKDAPPLTVDQEREAETQRLDHALAQILALCAYCGFAKRQGTEPPAEKQA